MPAGQAGGGRASWAGPCQAVTGDHIPYFNIDVLEELAGKQFGSSDAIQALNESAIDFDVYKNTLILWSASMTQPVQVDKVCCQVDILPTLSNLLGLPYDSRMLAGRDVLSDSEGWWCSPPAAGGRTGVL